MNEEMINKLNGISSGDLGTFMQNYRQALEDQQTADINALNNQRNLDYTTIMNSANRRGLLHSNFPARDKLRYDVSSYDPQYIKLRQSYQTGIDKLYENAAKFFNQHKDIEEKIADLNAI